MKLTGANKQQLLNIVKNIIDNPTIDKTSSDYLRIKTKLELILDTASKMKTKEEVFVYLVDKKILKAS